jgi:hypothetical protein
MMWRVGAIVGRTRSTRVYGRPPVGGMRIVHAVRIIVRSAEILEDPA